MSDYLEDILNTDIDTGSMNPGMSNTGMSDSAFNDYLSSLGIDTSSGGFTGVLKGLGNILKGTSDYGIAGQIAGLGGMGYLLNKLLGGGGGGYAGYQGGIPTLTASRQMLPIPQTVTNAQGQTVPRRPGSGGVTYFSPMTYAPVPTTAPPPQTPVEQAGPPVSLPASRETDDTAYLAAPVPAPAPAPVAAPVPAPVPAPAPAPVAAPVPAPVPAPAPAPVAAPAAAPAAAPVAAPVVNAGITSVLPKTAASVAAPAAAPAPDLSKYSAWEGYLTNPAFDKAQWLNALNRAYNVPNMNLWGVQNISAPEMEQYLTSKNVLTNQDIAAIRPKPQPAPALAYGDFEGKSEYFTPEGQYRQFTSTGTPIAPQRYGPEMGSIAGQVISPYSIGERAAGFKFQTPPVKAAEGGLMALAKGGRFLRGGGDGVSDSIPAQFAETGKPARLADGEFVLDARTVSEIGNGSSEAGARKLYAFMKAVHSARKKAGRGSKSGADKHLNKLLA